MIDLDALSRRHWSGRTPLSLLLFPLSLVYAAAVRVHRALYELGILHRQRLPVPVVVVGNFLAGGTGKTPLVLWLTQALAARGMRPAVVSRGYRGSAASPAAVSTSATAAAVGDEPLLLARRLAVPVWIGGDRARAARALLRSHPEVDVLVLDDGLQHWRLARDFEIAVFDDRGTGNGFLLPAGPLRETPRTVDAVVRNGATAAPGEFPMRLRPAGFYRLHDGAAVELSWLRAQRLHAAAAIGQPRRFFETLHGLGLTFTAHAFPDHHRYSPRDLRFVDCDVVVVTEKDAVKCAMDNRTDIVVLRVDAEVDAALVALVTDRIGRVIPSRAGRIDQADRRSASP